MSFVRSSPSSDTRSRENCRRHRVKRAAALLVVRDVLIAEILNRRGHRTGCAVAEGAERPPKDVVRQIEQGLNVFSGAEAFLQPVENLRVPERAFPARRAFPAGLVRVELAPPLHGADHAGRLVENLQGGGAEHRAVLRRSLKIKRDIEVFRGEERGRGTPGSPEFQFVTLPHAAGGVQQFTQGNSERRLVLAGPGDVTGERENLESWGFF